MAANAVTPLRAQAEQRGSGDFSPLWSGQAAALVRETDAGELTRALATGALDILGELGERSRAEQQAHRAPAGR
jgi:nitronate monooxygenase